MTHCLSTRAEVVRVTQLGLDILVELYSNNGSLRLYHFSLSKRKSWSWGLCYKTLHISFFTKKTTNLWTLRHKNFPHKIRRKLSYSSVIFLELNEKQLQRTKIQYFLCNKGIGKIRQYMGWGFSPSSPVFDFQSTQSISLEFFDVPGIHWQCCLE